MRVKFFDVAEEVINEATKRFSRYRLNEENVKKFKKYCEALDSLVDQFGIKAIEVGVDEITMRVEVVFECVCIECREDEETGLFYKVAQLANDIEISGTEDGITRVALTFPPLWENS